MKLGLRRGSVALEEHCLEWETAAGETIGELKEILEDAAVDIQHIGSTAVKDIPAKPIIDIAVGARDFESILGLNGLLEARGFIFRGQDHPRQYLYICGDDEIRTHHIHVVEYGSDEWNNYINLRDYLRSHRDDAEAYARLKRALAQEYADDRETYTEKKSGFIQGIIEKARMWRPGQPD